MPDETVKSRHCAELSGGRRDLYRVFDVLNASALDGDARDQIRKQIAALIDFLIWQEVRVDSAQLTSLMTRALAQDFMDPTLLVRAWNKAVAAALPSRASCREVTLSFLDTCETLPVELRPAFARGILPLCPYLSDWGKAGTTEIVKAIESVGSDKRVEALLSAAAGYAEADAQIMRAVILVAARLLAANRDNVVDAMTREVTVEKMMESREACRLLPALCKAMNSADALSSASAPIVVSCILAIAKINISSANAAARKLHKLATKLPAGRYDAYVRSVEKLTAEGDIRLLGFCLRKLPRLALRHDPEPMATFIRNATEIAQAYGTNAAEAFLRQETPAARESLRTQQTP